MLSSRRQFIIGTAAGLTLPSYYDKVLTFFENTGEALLEETGNSEADLLVMGAYGHSRLREMVLGGLGPS